MVIKVVRGAAWRDLPVFLIVCLSVFAFGGLFQPGDWYAALILPPWTPPNLAFPIVWSALYIFIAFAGWLIFASDQKDLKILWIGQLVLNALWSWIFFGRHWVLIGAADIILIDILVVCLIVKAWSVGERGAALLLSPYLAWILLATSLNVYIALVN